MAFTVLTAAQGATLRRRIGDTISGDYVLSDTELDALYTAASLDLDTTTVAALQELLGVYLMQVDVTDTNTLITEKRNQRKEGIQEALAYWEAKAGTAGGTISVGKLKHNINTKLADLDGS